MRTYSWPVLFPCPSYLPFQSDAPFKNFEKKSCKQDILKMQPRSLKLGQLMMSKLSDKLSKKIRQNDTLQF